MRVAVPHNLEIDEVRHRLKTRSHELGDHLPGDMAEVETDWPSENRMNMQIKAMGQEVTGHIDIEASQLVFEVELPLALSFVEPMIKGAIKKQGQKLLT